MVHYTFFFFFLFLLLLFFNIIIVANIYIDVIQYNNLKYNKINNTKIRITSTIKNIHNIRFENNCKENYDIDTF